jgi:hypothetical protein
LAIAAMRRFFDLIAGALLEILFESGLEHVDDRVTCDERVIVLRRGLGVRSAALGALGLRLARSCALSQVQRHQRCQHGIRLCPRHGSHRDGRARVSEARADRTHRRAGSASAICAWPPMCSIAATRPSARISAASPIHFGPRPRLLVATG